MEGTSMWFSKCLDLGREGKEKMIQRWVYSLSLIE